MPVPSTFRPRDPISHKLLDPNTCVIGTDGAFYNARTLQGDDDVVSLRTGVPVTQATEQLDENARAQLVEVMSQPLDPTTPGTLQDFVLDNAQDLMLQAKLPAYKEPVFVFFSNQAEGASSAIERLLHAHILPENLRVPIRVRLVPGGTTAAMPEVTQVARSTREPIAVDDVPVFKGTGTSSDAAGITEDQVPWNYLKEALDSRAQALLAEQDKTHKAKYPHPSAEIVVTLRGPRYPCMSFVDLPGRAVHPKGYDKEIDTIVHAYLEEENVYPVIVTTATNTLNNVAAFSTLMDHHRHLVPRSSVIFTRLDRDMAPVRTCKPMLQSELLQPFERRHSIVASPRDDEHRDHRAYADAPKAEEMLQSKLASLNVDGHIGMAAYMRVIKDLFDSNLQRSWIGPAYHAARLQQRDLHNELDELSPFFTTAVPEACKEWRRRANDADPTNKQVVLEPMLQYELRERAAEAGGRLLHACKHAMLSKIDTTTRSFVARFAAVEEEVRGAASGNKDTTASTEQLVASAQQHLGELRDELERAAAQLEEEGTNASGLSDILVEAMQTDDSPMKMHRFPNLIHDSAGALRALVHDRVDAVLASAVREFMQDYVASVRRVFTLRRLSDEASVLVYAPSVGDGDLAGKLQLYLATAGMSLDFDALERDVFHKNVAQLDLTEKPAVVSERKELFEKLTTVDKALVDVCQLRNRLSRQHHAARLRTFATQKITSEILVGLSEEEARSLRFVFEKDPAFIELKLELPSDKVKLGVIHPVLAIVAASEHVTRLNLCRVDFTQRGKRTSVPAMLDTLLRVAPSLQELTFTTPTLGSDLTWLREAVASNTTLRSLVFKFAGPEAKKSGDAVRAALGTLPTSHSTLAAVEVVETKNKNEQGEGKEAGDEKGDATADEAGDAGGEVEKEVSEPEVEDNQQEQEEEAETEEDEEGELDLSVPDNVHEVVASMTGEERREYLGDRLFAHVEFVDPENAPKITGMLLSYEVDDVINMIQNDDVLMDEVKQARAVLGLNKE